MIFLSLVLSFFSFVQFALCIKGHFRDLYKQNIPAKVFWTFQLLAWALLLASLYPCLLLWGGEIGVTTWLCMITLSALAVTTLITYYLRGFVFFWKLSPGAYLYRVLTKGNGLPQL